MSETNTEYDVSCVHEMSDLLAEIAERQSRDYNDVSSLILTAEQMRDAAARLPEGHPALFAVMASLDLYHYCLDRVPVEVFWELRQVVDASEPPEDDEEERLVLRHLTRGVAILRRRRIERAVELLADVARKKEIKKSKIILDGNYSAGA